MASAIRGAKKNEDVFSIQVMDTRERIQGYPKSNLQEVIYEKTSLMPAFAPGRLNDSDLNDLVGYLTHAARSGSWLVDDSMRRDLMRALLMIVIVLGHPGGADRRSAGDTAGSAGRSQGSDAVADLRRRLQRHPSQPADADHARERQSAVGAVDVPDRHARQLSDDAGRRSTA